MFSLQNENENLRRARRGLTRLAAACLTAAVAAGCANKKDAPPLANLEAPPTTVVSGTPEYDAAGFAQSSKQLEQVNYKKIDDKGPRASWEQLGGRDKQASTVPASADESSVRRAAATYDPPVVALPDGKVRMIYRLQNFGGASVTSKGGGTARRDIATKEADLAPLVNVVSAHLGNTGTVVPVPSENSLVITMPAESGQSVAELLRTLDVAARQVQITARIFEVSSDFDMQQGARILAKHAGNGNAQSLLSTFDAPAFKGAPAAGASQGSVIGLMRTFESAGVSVEASFQILASEGLIKVVSSPRMTVAEGQTGYMLAGQELPIQSAHFNNGNMITSISYKPVGVQLYITPRTVNDDSVKLHIVTAVSSISGFSPVPTLNGTTASTLLINPIIDSREAETAVAVADNETLVISGLRMVREIRREEKTPGLGDIPILGWLFKNHRSQKQMTDLYFFVTPTIL